MTARQLYLQLLSTRLIAQLQRALTPDPAANAGAPIFDVVFVTPPSTSPAWILDGICREVAQRLPGIRTTLHALGPPLPPARCYFFSHFAFFIESLKRISPVHRARSYVFATHLEADKYGIPDAQVARLLARATLVFCMNEALMQYLASLGTPRERMTTLVGASSSSIYRAHSRTRDGKVGFCSAYYERKSPQTILDIVRALPGRRFLLLGKGWRKYSRFPELEALPNFEYVEPEYSQYPAYYAQMSAFVSVSKKEGGPIPLIEAMMSNVVPVASHTGFAPDVIEHGRNGFLFPVDADVADICALIEQAFTLDTDVRATVMHCDWEQYTARIARAMALPPSSMVTGS